MESTEKRSEDEHSENNKIVPSTCSQGCFNGWLTFTSQEGERMFCPNCNPDGRFVT